MNHQATEEKHLRKKLLRKFIISGVVILAVGHIIIQFDPIIGFFNITAYCLYITILEVYSSKVNYFNRTCYENSSLWNISTIIYVFLLIIEILIAIINDINIIQSIVSWILSFIGCVFLTELLEMDKRNVMDKTNDNHKVLDYGTGMACSYFFGYLKIILPHYGDQRKGLQENIEDYESNNKGKLFGSKKLYILIPRSGFCPPSLDKSSRIIEKAKSLSYNVIDRAGVLERQYHNSVYKITPRGRENEYPTYVCAEYATPVLTLHEIISQNTDDSRQYEKCQEELVTNFYQTLQKLINTNRECRGLAELIYYRDVDNNGIPFDTNQLDIGELLLERINQDRIDNS